MQAKANSMHFAIADGVQWLESNGEYLFVDSRSEQVYGVDTVASDVLRHLMSGLTFEATLQKLTNVYDVETSRLEADMRNLLSSLEAKGLITLQGMA